MVPWYLLARQGDDLTCCLPFCVTLLPCYLATLFALQGDDSREVLITHTTNIACEVSFNAIIADDIM